MTERRLNFAYTTKKLQQLKGGICVCMCEREKERKGERKRERERGRNYVITYPSPFRSDTARAAPK